ncbi:MAG: hypothetical protein QM820_51940 [Minicystis sp.]
MTPSEQDLAVANAREDKSRRARLASIFAVALVFVLVLQAQPVIAGVPSVLWSLVILAGAIFVAWRGGLAARARALLGLAAIRREGLAATERLNQGDVEGAQRAYVALLRKAQPLGAFHAVHVLMYGITRFLEGDAKEGLRLTTRVLESGWLDMRPTREVRHEAETWRVLMLLDQGEVAEARKRVEASPGADLVLASIAVCAYEERWSEELDQVQKALDNPRFSKASRPMVAVLGIFAARKLGRKDAVAALKKVLDAEPLGPVARKNPVLSRFLGS